MGAVIALRIVHIGFGVFWVGSVLFMNFVIGPALGAAGPAGIQVMQELKRRRYFHVTLGTGLITILAGLDLMRRDSAGFQSAWFQTPFGKGLAAGMIAAILAFILGATVIRGSLKQMGTIGAQLAAAAPDQREALLAQLNAVRGKMIAAGIFGSLLLLIAVVAMAIARYLQ